MTNSTRFLFPQIQVCLIWTTLAGGTPNFLLQFSINPHLCRRLCDNFRLPLQSSCLTNQPSLKDASEHWGGVNCGHLTKDSLRKTETMAFGPSMGRTMAMIPILVPSIRSTMSAQCRRCWVGRRDDNTPDLGITFPLRLFSPSICPTDFPSDDSSLLSVFIV